LNKTAGESDRKQEKNKDLRRITRRGPGPGRPTGDQVQIRHQELLVEALDLFAENGVDRTSVDAIVAAVGMAKRTFYARYGNKLALFKASLERAIDDWIVPIERLRAVETDDLEETLVRIGRILVANVLSPAGLRLLRITNAEAWRVPGLGLYSVQHGTEPTAAYLVELFRRHRGPGESQISEPKQAAHAFLNLVVGGPASMSAWGAVLDRQTLEKGLHYHVKLFLYGAITPRKGHR
jgi:TetR/AcrR family transcriptional regulator, mexJK operon transcriptional repressor